MKKSVRAQSAYVSCEKRTRNQMLVTSASPGEIVLTETKRVANKVNKLAGRLVKTIASKLNWQVECR